MGSDGRFDRAFQTQCRCTNFNGHDGLSLSRSLISDEGSFKDLELTVKFKALRAKWTEREA